MKRYLFITFGFLVFSLILTIVVYWWIFLQMSPTDSVYDSDSSQIKENHSSSSESQITDKDNIGTTSTLFVMDIPLRDIPLGETQKSILDKVGVDIDTFVITPAMQACASEKLGEGRMAEIIAGDAPTVVETARLSLCLGVQ